MPQPYVPILLGTGREGRQSEKVARFVLAQAKAAGLDAELFDVRDYGSAVTIPSWEKNPCAKQWQTAVKQADALIMVIPEYNHSFPGEFKILLDSLFKEYVKKPVGLCAVSSGAFGGARMAEQLMPVFNYLQMVWVGPPVYFPKIKELFDEDGNIKDDSFLEKLKKLFADLRWYSAKLK